MDSEFAALELLHALSSSMVVITRLRQDACLFDPPSAENRRNARKGKRQLRLASRITDPTTG